MTIYLTHCSKEKDPAVKESGAAVTPDTLYTEPGIREFMERCKSAGVHWGILSDNYGVFLSGKRHTWYAKPPDAVTPEEETAIVESINTKLASYDEIRFYIRRKSFHPFYRRVLEKSALARHVRYFDNLDTLGV